MGSSQSIQPRPDSDSDSNSNSEYDDEEQEDETNRRLLTSPTINPSSKVVEQEPEILPCHQSASPLSVVCTPRSNGGGPHIKVWDACHILLPPPSRSFHDVSNNDATTEIYLISHGESAASLRPDLVTGRWAKAGLTGNGESQARAMAVFLKSNRVHFQKVFCSPLDRALMTAALVCRDSPIFNFINNLSPIQPVKSTHELQVFQSLSFASISAIFSSPQVNSPKESRFSTRHTYSSSPQLDIPSDNSNENTQPIAFNSCKVTCLLNKASFDIPEENTTQPAQSSQPIQFECDSPDHSIKPCHGIKNEFNMYSNISQVQVEVQNEHHQVTKSNEEDASDRDNVISNVAENFLIFDENTEQETCNLHEENDKNHDYKSSMLMISELEPSLHNGGVKEHATDHSQQLLSNTFQNQVPSNNINKEPEEPDIGISKSCKVESQQQRGMKRRCLSFDLSKASVNNSKISIDSKKSADVKQGSSSSSYVLPSIGLHLNTLATSQYDSRFISPILSVRTGDKFFSKLNVKRDKCPTDSKAHGINVDTSEATELGSGGSLSQSSPKKRKLEGGESEGCKRCNCKKSKCLKLYCECFHAGIYCVEPCSCKGCFNKPIHEEIVLATRKQIESRNPLAFAPKVMRVPESAENMISEETNKTPASARHKTGCNCKKSSCLKKYCECYQGGVGCSLSCRCESCKNVFGRKDGFFLLTVEEIETADVHEKEHGKLHKDEQNALVEKTGDHSVENMLPNTSSFGIHRPTITSSSLPSQKPPRSRPLKKCEVPPLSNITNQVQNIHETSKDDFSPKNVAVKKNMSPNGKRVLPPRKEHEMLAIRKGRKLVLEVMPPFPSLNDDTANENRSTFI